MSKTAQKPRLAVVLFNLGGPDSLDSVQPFLFNLFSDPAIIGVPQPLRWLIAKLVSRRRTEEAREIYRVLGGRSPLLEETENQARALEAALAERFDCRVFISMRYWHPLSEETVSEVARFEPEEIILLPLYPQYSTTTTASSLKDWKSAAEAAGLERPTQALCCYPSHPGLVATHVDLIKEALEEFSDDPAPRILFSAHGLPEKIVLGGDPYAWQVEKTVSAILDSLQRAAGEPVPDHVVCYQSRVGPLKWLEPSTEEEIRRAGRDGRAVLVVPVAFVSEHSETLYELDVLYADLAKEAGVPNYRRVRALRCEKKFIGTLARLVEDAVGGEALACGLGDRCCPGKYRNCPLPDGSRS